VQARVGGLPASVEQHVIGFDRSQQAVQGQGIQVNTFGGQDEPGSGQ
jgi:hypothetical protein